jgi:hypothetical protein
MRRIPEPIFRPMEGIHPQTFTRRADRLDCRAWKHLREGLRAGGHDYAGTKIEIIFAFCRTTQVQLDAICGRVDAYAGQILSA